MPREYIRPLSLRRLVAERQLAARLAELTREYAAVQAEFAALLAERGYRPMDLRRDEYGRWSAQFTPMAADDDEVLSITGRTGRDILDNLRIYPTRQPGGRFVNTVAIAAAFVNAGMGAFRALGAFTAPVEHQPATDA